MHCSSPHTPGPWEARAEVVRTIAEDANGGFVIALACGPNWKSNAAVMAALPEMYDACRCALGHLTGNMDGDMDLGDPVEMLRAAVAKAGTSA